MTLVSNSVRPDIAVMRDRLARALLDQQVRFLVEDDLTDTFVQIGLPESEHKHLVHWIVGSLMKPIDLLVTEHTINAHLKRLTVKGRPMLKVVDEMLSGRAQLIYDQTHGFFSADDRILDLGCGDGQVTDLFYRNVSSRIEGFDVKDYVKPGMQAASFGTYDGRKLPIRDEWYDAALMTNVAHHSDDNAQLLRELARVVRPGGTVVVIETVPIEDDPVEFERTFVNDYVYNRLFHSADVPVPGTYETLEGWVKRFDTVELDLLNYAPDCVNPANLGYDQPLIKDCHVLYVLRKRR